LEAHNISQKTDASMQTNKESMENTQQIEQPQIQNKSDNIILEENNNNSTPTTQTKDLDFQHKLVTALESLPEQINSEEQNAPTNDSHLVDNNADFLNEVMQAISSDAKQFITSGEQNSCEKIVEKNSVAEVNNVEKEQQHFEVVKTSVETNVEEETEETEKPAEIIAEKVSIDNRVDTPEIPQEELPTSADAISDKQEVTVVLQNDNAVTDSPVKSTEKLVTQPDHPLADGGAQIIQNPATTSQTKPALTQQSSTSPTKTAETSTVIQNPGVVQPAEVSSGTKQTPGNKALEGVDREALERGGEPLTQVHTKRTKCCICCSVM